MAKAWHLVSRPAGLPDHSNFALRELPDAPLAEGQLRVRNDWLSVDPYMRGRMNDAKSYAAAFELDQPMTGGAIGEVLESRLDGFAPGDLILHMGGWRDGGIIGLDMMPNKLPAPLLEMGISPQTFLHNLGLTGGTAWIGLHRVAQAKQGETGDDGIEFQTGGDAQQCNARERRQPSLAHNQQRRKADQRKDDEIVVRTVDRHHHRWRKQAEGGDNHIAWIARPQSGQRRGQKSDHE